MASFDYDVAIIGSGFGGSVVAIRAAEKGYRVGVIEAGPAVAGPEDPEEPVGPGAPHLAPRLGALRSPEDRIPR
jgi:choline dehydrogenase-like flavoprotein